MLISIYLYPCTIQTYISTHVARLQVKHKKNSKKEILHLECDLFKSYYRNIKSL